MIRTTNLLLPIAMLAVLSILPAQAKAGIIIEYYESGSNLVLEYSGSLNVSQQTGSGSIRNAWGNQYQDTLNSVFYSSPNNYGFLGVFDVVSATNDSFWGAGRGYDTTGNSSTGDTFLFRYNRALSANTVSIWLGENQNYTAGDSIAGSLTLGGQSIVSTGVIDWTVDLGEVGTIQIRSRSMVPEPVTLTIFGSMVGLIAIRRRRS